MKHAGRGLCVPDYVRPAAGDTGWTYSQVRRSTAQQSRRLCVEALVLCCCITPCPQGMVMAHWRLLLPQQQGPKHSSVQAPTPQS